MSLSFALLGLLNYSPMTGYDLKKVFDDSINFFWSAQMSQIYRELKLLENRGDITSMVEPSGKGPDKRIYQITDQGRLSLKEWLSDTSDEMDETNRNAFLVRVFFSSHVGVDELYFQMQKRLKVYEKYFKNLKEVESRLKDYVRMVGQEDEFHYWKIVLNRGYYDAEANIRWAEETIGYLKKLKEGEKV